MRFSTPEKYFEPPIPGTRCVELTCTPSKTVMLSDLSAAGFGFGEVSMKDRALVTRGKAFVVCKVTTNALPPLDDGTVVYSATVVLSQESHAILEGEAMKKAGAKLAEMAQFSYTSHAHAVQFAEQAFAKVIREAVSSRG